MNMSKRNVLHDVLEYYTRKYPWHFEHNDYKTLLQNVKHVKLDRVKAKDCKNNLILLLL